MTRRRPLTGKARLALLQDHASRCHICGGEIVPGQAWEVEHLIPLAMGGDDEPHNMRPAHSKCHQAKTVDDLGAIAKAKRIQIKHCGAKPKPKSEFPGGKGSKWKRTIDGRTVRREGEQ